MLVPILFLSCLSVYLFNRNEIRFANLALISGRQMFTRASTVPIFLVAITKKKVYSNGGSFSNSGGTLINPSASCVVMRTHAR